jgi:hypothetical protein
MISVNLCASTFHLSQMMAGVLIMVRQNRPDRANQPEFPTAMRAKEDHEHNRNDD